MYLFPDIVSAIDQRLAPDVQFPGCEDAYAWGLCRYVVWIFFLGEGWGMNMCGAALIVEVGIDCCVCGVLIGRGVIA